MNPAMSNHNFGPRLRRWRERCGVSLHTIAERTNVSVTLWQGMEADDFSRWPKGVFARAFIRDYAEIVGLDADEVVNEFCQNFAIGDRRIESIIRAKAGTIGVASQYTDDRAGMPATGDRRCPATPDVDDASGPVPAAAMARFNSLHQRLAATGVDTVALLFLATATAFATGNGFWSVLAVASLAYHTLTIAFPSASVGARLLQVSGEGRLPNATKADPALAKA